MAVTTGRTRTDYDVTNFGRDERKETCGSDDDVSNYGSEKTKTNRDWL